MAKSKYFYYVLVLTNEGNARFVTGINNTNKYAHWKSNEKPMKMSKSTAENLAYCLNLNFYPSFILQSFYEINEQLFNRQEN